LYNSHVMKRLSVLVGVMLAVSPVYGIGFWGEFGGGMGNFSHGDITSVSESGGNTSEVTVDYSGGGMVMGGNFAGGVSLAPLPLLIGIGVGYYIGSGSSEGTVGDISVKSDWDMTRFNVKVPIAYKMGLTAAQVLLGVAPGMNSVTFKDKDGNDESTYTGVGFGVFGKGYFMLGAFGIGGGVSIDFIPALSNTETTEIFGTTVTTTTTLKGNTNIGLDFGVFFLSGLLE